MLSFDAENQQSVQIGVKFNHIQNHSCALRIFGTCRNGHIIVGICLRTHQMIGSEIISHTFHAFCFFRLLHVGKYGSIPCDGCTLKIAERIVIRYRIGQRTAAPAARISHFLHVLGVSEEGIKFISQLDIFFGGNIPFIFIHHIHIAAVQRQEGICLLTVYIPQLIVVSGCRQGIDTAFRWFLFRNCEHIFFVILPGLQLTHSVFFHQILSYRHDLSHG